MSSLRSFADYVTLLSATQRAHHCGLKRSHDPHNDCPGTPPFTTQSAPTSSRPSWDEYFITLVDAAAARASCDRGRSGAVFMRDNDVLATGYVGAPPGLPDCLQAGHLIQRVEAVAAVGSFHSSFTLRDHCVRTIHAEQNGILRAARNGISLKSATVYCTMEPCANCAMSLIGLGVTRVVAKNAYHAAERTRALFAAVGIQLEVLSGEFLYDKTQFCCSEFAKTGHAHTEACCYIGEDV